ncbi:rhamnosyltransferase [Schumannella luteola]|uniref:Rhamnosyltransferase n=1 Tax=Schumannella luteola TaxID=472059 RepID=A0A852Y8J2_9MICO|nr:rhamnosyltransferase [Schumannella luteola]
MTGRVGELAAFPSNGRRVIFYLYYDPRGEVDDYVLYKLERLRPFAEHIFVVVNGELTPAAHERMATVSDTIWQRENVGFDVWGYKKALEEFGRDRLADYDELLLMNYTWFGPVNPFEPIFERMDAQKLDFWGMTEHGEQTPNPFTRTGKLHAHIQSHWISVRRSMFLSDEWAEYWDTMPPIVSYTDSILSHESKFTHHFREAGFTVDIAYKRRDYSTWHPAFYDAEALLDDGCPVLKRRPFFHDPLLVDRHAIIPRRFLEKADSLGYPTELILQNMARDAQPKVLNTNAAMLEIMPDVDISYDPESPLRIAVMIHIFYVELADELLGAAANLPSDYDVYITTTDDDRAAAIQQIIDDRADPKLQRSEIRVLPSNRGRDIGAFFVGMADVLRARDYDVIFKIHSKKTVQEGANAGDLFRRHQLVNLLNSPGYAANLVALFQQHPDLGLAYAPTLHIGYPTLGRGWFDNKEAAREMADELGIRVPFDEPTPLAPYGCMFAFRPESLSLLTDPEWEYDDYPLPTEHIDGSIAHVQERLFSYAAAELGYHTRTVATTRYAAISHTSLEYKLDRMSANVPGYAEEQISTLDRSGTFIGGGPAGYVMAYTKLRHPRIYPAVRAVYRPVRAVYRPMRRAYWLAKSVVDPRVRRYRREQALAALETAETTGEAPQTTAEEPETRVP